jgi:AcrR family transcriptional regulator
MDTSDRDREKTGVRDPVQARGIRTKEKIIEAGTALFSQRGYHNVTADEIARAAGVSVGTFYSYFSDKRDLFLTVVHNFFIQCDDVVVQAVDASTSVGRAGAFSLIMEMINLLVSVHRAASPLLSEILKMSLADGEVERRLDDVDERIMAVIERALVRTGMDERRAAAVAFVIYQAGEGVIHQVALGRHRIDEEAVLSELARLFSSYVKEVT